MDQNLADYLTSRYNTVISFKDMSIVNQIGILQGIDVSGFLVHFWGLIIDLLFIGLERASDYIGNPLQPNDFLSFDSFQTEDQHPLKLYTRHLDKFHCVFRFKKEEQEELVQTFLQENENFTEENLLDYNVRTCWPLDQSFRANKYDILLSKALIHEISKRLP